MTKIRKDDVMDSLAFALQAGSVADGAGVAGSQVQPAMFLPLNEIQPDPNQPRRLTDEVDEDLELLATSILRHGVIQPITVRKTPEGFQIVTGERRWRASKIAQSKGQKCERPGYDLTRIPTVLVEPQSDADRLEMQMVENLARADMNPLDTAYALQSLLETQKVSLEELGRRLGRSRAWVNQMISRVHPDAHALAKHLNVNVADIGQNELVRLMAWWRDTEGKRAIFTDLQKSLGGGAELKRTLIDDAEAQWVLRSGLGLEDRRDMSLDQLRQAQDWVSSDDSAKRQAFQNLKSGMTFDEALRSAYSTPSPFSENASEDVSGETTEKESGGGGSRGYSGGGSTGYSGGDSSRGYSYSGGGHSSKDEDEEPDFSGVLTSLASEAVAMGDHGNEGDDRGQADYPSSGTETYGHSWESQSDSGVSDAATAFAESAGVTADVVVRLSTEFLDRLFQKLGRSYHPLQDDTTDVLAALEEILSL